MDDIEAVIFELIIIFVGFPVIFLLFWSESGMPLKRFLRELKKDWRY